MPHNNRMSTSASLKTHAIWQTTIGHDPYANEAEANNGGSTDADKEKAKSVMEMARSQNLTDGAERSGFTAQMYRGLKQGKKRRADAMKDQNDGIDPQLRELLEDASSSSEDEFVEVIEAKKEAKKKKKKSRKKHKRQRKQISSSESDNGSSDESSTRERQRSKKDRKKKQRRRYRESSVDSESEESDSERRKRKRKYKERKRNK